MLPLGLKLIIALRVTWSWMEKAVFLAGSLLLVGLDRLDALALYGLVAGAVGLITRVPAARLAERAGPGLRGITAGLALAGAAWSLVLAAGDPWAHPLAAPFWLCPLWVARAFVDSSLSQSMLLAASSRQLVASGGVYRSLRSLALAAAPLVAQVVLTRWGYRPLLSAYALTQCALAAVAWWGRLGKDRRLERDGLASGPPSANTRRTVRLLAGATLAGSALAAATLLWIAQRYAQLDPGRYSLYLSGTLAGGVLAGLLAIHKGLARPRLGWPFALRWGTALALAGMLGTTGVDLGWAVLLGLAAALHRVLLFGWVKLAIGPSRAQSSLSLLEVTSEIGTMAGNAALPMLLLLGPMAGPGLICLELALGAVMVGLARRDSNRNGADLGSLPA
jgi:hypothetical protein